MFTLTFGNLSFLVTQPRKCLLCRYSANTYRMYYRHRSYHKTADYSCSRQLLENQFSSDHLRRKSIFLCMLFKRKGCTTEIEIIVKRVNWAVHSNFAKSSFSVTQWRECVLCWYSTKTYRMSYKHRSHHNTGDFSCSRQHLENRAF